MTDDAHWYVRTHRSGRLFWASYLHMPPMLRAGPFLGFTHGMAQKRAFRYASKKKLEFRRLSEATKVFVP